MGITNGSATRPTTTDAVWGIALKIGSTIIKNAGITGKYADFDKAYLDGILEDLKVKLKASAVYNPNATGVLAPQYDTIVKRYFGDWSPRRYDTEVNQSRAKSIVTGEAQLSDFVAKIINNLTESELQEANDDYKKLFCNTDHTDTGIGNTLASIDDDDNTGTNADDIADIITAGGHGYLVTANLYEAFDLPTADTVLTEIRNVVKDMTFANTTYDGVSGTGKHESRLEDLRIVANYKWINDLDVTKLANTFQLQKADMMAQIVETDACEWTYTDSTATTGKITSAHGYVVIICDKNAVGRVLKGKEMNTAFVKERFTQWYGLIEDVMCYYNPTEKAWALFFTDSKTLA